MLRSSLRDKSVILPSIALLGVSFIGSIMGIFARALATDLNVPEQVGLRSLMGAFVLFIVGRRSIQFGNYRRTPVSDLRLTIVRAISMFVVGISLGTVAFVHGNYASVAVMMALPMPALLSALLLRERISSREILLVCIAFMGASITIFSSHGFRAGSNWPLLCAIAATFFMSYGIIARKKQSPFLNNIETTFLMLIVASVIMLSVSCLCILGRHSIPHINFYTIAISMAAGVANIAFLMLSNYAIPLLRGVISNNILALQPVFGAIVGFFVFGESIPVLSLFGSALIIFSLLLLANPNMCARLGRKGAPSIQSNSGNRY